jgi:acetyl-CoA carboxylase carboxyltransferase component
MHDQASPARTQPRPFAGGVSGSDPAVGESLRGLHDAAAARPLELLCDPHSLRQLPSRVPAVRVGVVAATGTVEGRPVVCYAHDASLAAGSVGRVEADVIVEALRLARHRGVPVVAFLQCAGARLQEGAAALGGFGRIFSENVALSARAPQISVITGTSAGGGVYSPALTDFIVMTGPSAMFLTGPGVVREVTGEHVDAAGLGGARVHQATGVCDFVADDAAEAAAVTRRLLGYLPSRVGRSVRRPPEPPIDGDPGRHVPRAARQVYDVLDVARSLSDSGDVLEVAPRFARNLVTAFARIDGRAVGIIANQPRYLGGVLDAKACDKGARFVSTCDRLCVPLVVLVDTPGFMPGTRQEGAGIIRRGAQLVRAFAAATVPRLTVVLRKAFGGGFITMNSKDLGADLALAWTGAEIGVMGAPAAVKILHRRELASARSPEAVAGSLAEQYAARHITAERAVRDGVIDAVISPRETRSRLVGALDDV